MSKKDLEPIFQDLRIFLVEDDDTIAWSVESELKGLGAEVKRANSLRKAFELFPDFQADLAISDLNLPDGHGLDLLKRWKKDDPALPVILITAHGAIDSAITALRLGAFDYLQKPFAMDQLVAAVRRAAEVGHLRRKVIQYEGLEKKTELNIIGQSEPMDKLRRVLQRVAASKIDTVLIHGESGSGKELAARAIHEWSNRADQPFVEINCASIPESLLESELFGYEKGAFTDAKDRKLGLFEIARGGTVFLDEVGEMPLKLQAKLLRVLEYKRFKRLGGVKDIEFKGRIVAATNRRLQEEITSGNFRADLYYRLNVVSVTVPSLRDHAADIPVLLDHLLEQVCSSLEVKKPEVPQSTIQALKSYRWPGNVRELKNSLQRALVFYNPTILKPEHFDFAEKDTAADKAQNANPVLSLDQNVDGARRVKLPESGVNLEDLERDLLNQALEMARFNQTKAAQLLGITRHTLRYRLEKFGLLEAHHE